MKMHKYLRKLLSVKRPSGGAGEQLARDLIHEVIADANQLSQEDIHGNIICTTKFNGVLFSSHMDTVHWSEGTLEVRMDEFGIITGWSKEARRPRLPQMGLKPVTHSLSGKTERDILGADDAAGIYVMLRMIEEGIHGTYVFHTAEEIGCLGSKAIADERYSVDGWDLEEDFTHAIAFDRKGTSDLVFKQLGERMCSMQFANELSHRLACAAGLIYRPAEGLVTDTAMYADYVQECINLSIGYYDEHTEDERLDYGHVTLLLNAIIEEQDIFENLPVARELPDFMDAPYMDEDYPTTIEGLCAEYPDAIADVLKTLGYDYDELFHQLNQADLI